MASDISSDRSEPTDPAEAMSGEQRKLVYLACPYSHPDEAKRVERFNDANRVASVLMKTGVFVFSPISHTHPIALYGLPLGWDFWEPYDRVFINQCKAMLVIGIDGWDESKGVRAEMNIAREMGIPIGFIWSPMDAAYIRHVAKIAGLIALDIDGRATLTEKGKARLEENRP